MSTKLWAIGLMFVCTLLTSSAQILYKFGANQLPLIFFNWPLLVGLSLYATGALVFVVALKGGDVSVLFPIIATSYIWVSILSNYFFNEPLNIFKWIGILSIVVGISIIGYGSKKKSINQIQSI